jgi:hypothetical protein
VAGSLALAMVWAGVAVAGPALVPLGAAAAAAELQPAVFLVQRAPALEAPELAAMVQVVRRARIAAAAVEPRPVAMVRMVRAAGVEAG